MPTRILAVHHTAHHVSFAVGESSLRRLHVTALGRVDAGSEVLRQLASERAWDRVVASLPADAAVFRFLQFPFHDRRRLSQAVGPALEEHVPFSLDESRIAFDLAGRQSQSPVLAVMAPTSAIDAHTSLLQSHGVEAERLVWAPSAALALYGLAAGEDATFAAVEVGDEGAVVACFERRRLTGLRVLHRADRETLVRNLVWSLRTLNPPARVIVGGSLAMDLTGSLAEALSGFAVEQLPFDCPIELDEGAAPGWRGCVTPIGLVLAATGQLGSPLIEFSLHATSESELNDARQAALRLAPWAAVAVAGLAIAGGFEYASLRRQTAALEEQALTLARSVLPGGTAGPGLLTKLQMRAAELERQHNEAGGPGVEMSPLQVLAAMSASVPRDLDVEFDTYVYEPPGVRLRGQGGSFETVTLLQQALEANDRFRDVAVSDVRAAAGGEGVVFEMRLQFGSQQGDA